ncbi:uncharacterized protein LOC114531130 [Dendronephthya gigantea]|uniref:uncharacterized protein LOC114531130 n=1 Tax=Dendronephthya gigantea TaxID=151771 RepID=UPI00106D28D5|nr:uncharacterized protein LOC114531130 [Dendronephthya gigantea]
MSCRYQCLLLVYVLLIYYNPINGYKLKKTAPNGLGIMDFYYNSIQTSFLERCPEKLSYEKPRPCVYNSCNRIVWVEKNMTQELRKWMNLENNKKVRSEEEIMLVPTCTCNSCPQKHVERLSYKFTIVNTETNEFSYAMKYNIKVCTSCE